MAPIVVVGREGRKLLNYLYLLGAVKNEQIGYFSLDGLRDDRARS